jgi:hypothetical protein
MEALEIIRIVLVLIIAGALGVLFWRFASTTE